MMSRVAVILMTVAMIGGCASLGSRTPAAGGAEGSATPPTDLAGTWTGTAFAVAGFNARQGDHLWGVSGAFIPGTPSAVDLRRHS
jgi:hypothetical protein